MKKNKTAASTQSSPGGISDCHKKHRATKVLLTVGLREEAAPVKKATQESEAEADQIEQNKQANKNITV